jgi:cell division GTPase FtsZ
MGILTVGIVTSPSLEGKKKMEKPEKGIAALREGGLPGSIPNERFA